MRHTLQNVGVNQWKCPYCDKVWPTPVTQRKAAMPLEQKCKELANKEVEKCPHLSVKGTRGARRITMNKQDYPCRRRWMDEYLKCEKKKHEPQIEPDDPVKHCGAKGVLIVIVKNKDSGDAVNRATVEIFGPEQRRKEGTNELGREEFRNLKPGSYNVTASLSGYDHVKKGDGQAKVSACKTTKVIIEIVATGSLIVTVKEASKGYSNGASLKVNGPTNKSGVTGANGRLVFEYIPGGKYTVRASKGHFVTATKEILVIVGETSNVEMELPKTKRVPVQWIVKTLEYHSGMHGKIVSKSNRVIREKYMIVPDNWIEYGVEKDEKERGNLPVGDVWYITRYTAVYRTPDGLYYSEKIGNTAIKIFKILTFDVEGNVDFVYKSWSEFQGAASDPLEKYRPKN